MGFYEQRVRKQRDPQEGGSARAPAGAEAEELPEALAQSSGAKGQEPLFSSPMAKKGPARGLSRCAPEEETNDSGSRRALVDGSRR